MGKRASKFKHHQHGQKKIKNDWSSPNLPQDNPLFKSYYQLQLNLPHQQFELFWTTMKQKLPVVFRINPTCPNYITFRQKIQHPLFLNSMLQEKEDNVVQQQDKYEPKEIPKIEILPWYPGNILHQINTTKQIFKKSKVLNNLHKYLQKAFDAGLIARQELVSMLPPLFLNVQHDDIILDMCAAPGSKTSQLLQMIYGEERTLAPGCVIANDADYSRAQMLIHQINRFGTVGMAVINHPGQFLPELYSDKVNHIKQKFLFDKILCDVPCSGDGATRKIPNKWAKWHTSDGLSLHPLQLAILMKSINLLKRGGLIVYSTCSLNPIQNQAVLSGLFKKVGRGLQILDIHQIYDIKGRRGMLDWKVCTVDTAYNKIIVEGEQKNEKLRYVKPYDNYESAKADLKVKESMFAPGLQEAERIQLHHSMRILPHDQNSGGFFIALMRKNEDFQWKYDHSKRSKLVDEKEEANELNIRDQEFVDNNLPQVEKAVVDEADLQKAQQKEQQSEDQQQIEEEKPVVPQKIQQKVQTHKSVKEKKHLAKYQKFQNLKQEQFEVIHKFYGLSEELRELLYVREVDGNAKKNVLLVSRGVRRFLEADREKKIKLINMGCKVLEKGKESFAGYECLYRLSQEGIHFLLPFMTQRKVRVSLEFFRSVLSIHSVVHEDIKELETKEKIHGMSQGSFCIYIDEIIEGRRVVDAMVGQNFKSSFHLMVGKEELASLNLRYL